MGFWKDYVNSKPEVDDRDLPLPEHRLYDDDGNVRHAVEAEVRSFLQRARASARKATTLTGKKRDSLLKAVGSRWSGRHAIITSENAKVSSSSDDEEQAAPAPRRSSTGRASVKSPAKPATPAKSPAKSPAARRSSTGRPSAKSPAKPATPAKSPAKSPAARRSSTGKTATPARSRASSAKRATASPSRSPQRKTATPSGKAKASPRRSRQVSRSPSPAKTTSPVAKRVRRSASRGASRSQSRSQRATSARSPPTAHPSPNWTVAALREFATEKDINLRGARNKTEILAAIGNSP